MTDTPLTPLAADFETPDEAAWRTLAEAGLKGMPWERLIGRTADGVLIAPLYRETDFASAQNASGLPGQAPFTRGAHAVRDRYLPWDIRQLVARADARSANADALDDLARGVSSVELKVGSGGVGVGEIATALDGVLLDLAPVALSADHFGLDAAIALHQMYRDAQIDPAAARPVFNIDPVAAWMMHGAAPEPIETALNKAAAFALEAGARWPHALCVRASGRTAHEAGATPAQEVAVMLASGVAHLRAMENAGLSPERASGAIAFALSVGADVIPEIAKLRAARLLWARVMEACNAPDVARSMTLQAITSRRMMTRDDAWTNILRGTAACFAASVGGADVVTVLPLTAALGEASPQARRIARNTQIILMEESHLGRVADPGGGAWAIEKLTQDIAAAAWAKFQAIEAKGGLPAALRAGFVQADILAAHDAVVKDIARRKSPITGVSDFPLLDETPPAFGATIAPTSETVAADPITPSPWTRVAEPFERLRDRAKTMSAAHVFCATLGPLAEFSPRANFAQNLMAAGGVRAIGVDTAYETLDAIISAFQQSTCTVAVMCGADPRYEAEGKAAVAALKAAGAYWVIYAGKPADEITWREAGVDQFIFAGQNAIDALTTVQAALGIPQ